MDMTGVVDAARRVVRGAVVAAVMSWPAAGLASGGIDLVSHQAVYRMGLAASEPGSGIIGADGALLFRFADRCDGWTSEISSDLYIDYGESGIVHTRWTFVSWESKDGLRYRFRSREWQDGQGDANLVSGSARLEASGGGQATYDQPKEVTLTLPPGTLFPTRHLIALIDAGRRGERFLSVPLFDGSTTDNPYAVSAVVHALDDAEQAESAAVAGLAKAPAWDYSLAFFAPSSTGGLPDFALSVRYRDDGVSDRLVQDYGDFAVNVTMEQFAPLPTGGCSRQ